MTPETAKLKPAAKRQGSLACLLARLRALAKGVTPSFDLLRRWSNGLLSQSQTAPALKIASYCLVLMDTDGQVIWTREWDAGGVFEFGPRQRLWVWCGFTNYSRSETEIAEYEIELMSEDGLVIERFSNSFGDSLIVPPGRSENFPAEWRM